VPFKAIKSL